MEGKPNKTTGKGKRVLEKTTAQPLSVKIVTRMAIGSIFLYAFANSMMNVSINQVVGEFSLFGASQGLMSSMFSVGTMLALLCAPLIQGRIAKVVVLLTSTLLQAAALVVCGWASGFTLFCASCVFLGAGGGLVDAYANSMLADVHKEHSARYFGYLHGLFGVGSLVAPVLFFQVMQWLGWRGAFYGIGGMLLLGVAALWLSKGRVKPAEMELATRENKLRWQDLWEYGRNPRNRAVLMAGVFGTATQMGILVWAMRYMELRFQAEDLGALSISLFWICATVNRFSISHLKVEPVRLLVAGAFLAALCLGIGVFSGSAIGMCITMALLGLCTGHFMQVLFSEANRGHAGRTTFATSVMIVVMGLTRTVLPLLMAWVSARFSVVAGMMIPGVMAIGVAFSGLWLTRLDSRMPQESPHTVS